MTVGTLGAYFPGEGAAPVPAIVKHVHGPNTVDLDLYPAADAPGEMTSVSVVTEGDSGHDGAHFEVGDVPFRESAGIGDEGYGAGVLDWLTAQFRSVIGPMLVMLYYANRENIPEAMGRALTPPASSIAFLCRSLGINEQADIQAVTAAAQQWGQTGGEIFVIIADIKARQAGATGG